MENCIEADQQHAVRRFAKMHAAILNVGKDCSQSLARERGRLVGPDHQHEFPTVVAPLFKGLVAPPDNQEALSLDRNFLVRCHGLRPFPAKQAQ